MERVIKIFTIFSIVINAFFVNANDDVSYREIVINEYGGLAAFSETNSWVDVDSLIIRGKFGVEDFKLVSDWINQGKICSLDLVNAEIENAEIPDMAFAYTRIRGIALPDGLERIGIGAFYQSELRYVNIPSSLSEIGMGCFHLCMKLKGKLTLPDKIEEIQHSSFEGCAISEVSLPIALRRIGINAFKNSSIQTVEFPTGLREIEDGAFEGCSNLSCIIIPDEVFYIGRNSFSRNDNLKQITLGKRLIYLTDYAFSNCSSLEEVIIPGNIKQIGIGAFIGCENLKSVSFGEGIKRIKEFAFKDTGIENLKFPTTMSQLEMQSFYNLSSLKSVISLSPYVSAISSLVNAATREFDSNACAFGGTTPKDAPVYVPEEYLSNYEKEITGWGYFSTLLPLKTQSDVKEIVSSTDYKINKDNNRIVINILSSADKANFSIDSISGLRICSGLCEGYFCSEELTPGIYIVKMRNQSIKIVI